MLIQTLKNNKTPCLNCKDRKVGCHSTCERYIKWKQSISELKEQERHEKFYNSDIRKMLKTNSQQERIKRQRDKKK